MIIRCDSVLVGGSLVTSLSSEGGGGMCHNLSSEEYPDLSSEGHGGMYPSLINECGDHTCYSLSSKGGGGTCSSLSSEGVVKGAQDCVLRGTDTCTRVLD